MYVPRGPNLVYEYVPSDRINAGRPRKRWRDQHSGGQNEPVGFYPVDYSYYSSYYYYYYYYYY
jgi:hypothetical protein